MLMSRNEAAILQTRHRGNTRPRKRRQLLDVPVRADAIDEHIVVPWSGPIAIGLALPIEWWRLIALRQGKSSATEHRHRADPEENTDSHAKE
jgi:hypothetical protein